MFSHSPPQGIKGIHFATAPVSTLRWNVEVIKGHICISLLDIVPCLLRFGMDWTALKCWTNQRTICCLFTDASSANLSLETLIVYQLGHRSLMTLPSLLFLKLFKICTTSFKIQFEIGSLSSVNGFVRHCQILSVIRVGLHGNNLLGTECKISLKLLFFCIY